MPLLFAFESEEAGNEMSGVKPRPWAVFEARWNDILADGGSVKTGVTPRVILADGELVGSVNIAPQDGLVSIGYRMSQRHWGRGIATRAVAAILAEYTLRPLFAQTATHNQASLRVLEKNGFVVVSRGITPASERIVARESVRLVLGPSAGAEGALRS